jgi:hypothetical protein
MGATLSIIFRGIAGLAMLIGASFSALAAEIREGQTIWVRAGASIELESLDKKLYSAPAGTSLVVQKVSLVKGSKGTFSVATVQDAAGNVYRTLADNFRGKVDQSAVQSAVKALVNAPAAFQILSGPQPACAQNSMGAAEAQTAASATNCMSTKKHPACTKTPCYLEPPSDSAMKKFYPLIVETLNSADVAVSNARARARGIAEIHPAMIASIIAAETSGNPLGTFTEKSGRQGKGIGQYTYFEKAAGANLDYNAPKPSLETVFGTQVNTPYPLTYKGSTRLVYSVWSPKGVILGMATDLGRILAEDRYITPRGKTGAPIPGAVPVEVSITYKNSAPQAMRYLAGHHNRQDRVFQSIEEHYRQKGRLPSEYGEAWGVAPVQGTPKYGLLYGQCINRCYVEKIAGLCGGASGFFARYLNHFTRGPDGTWKVAG